jgi:hypothetical protein
MFFICIPVLSLSGPSSAENLDRENLRRGDDNGTLVIILKSGREQSYRIADVARIEFRSGTIASQPPPISAPTTPSKPPSTSGTTVGKFFSGEAYQDGTSKKWPFNLRLNYLNQSTGEVIGEIHWTSLGSVHKIVGTLYGNRLRFKETEYIKRGGADLNCTYDLSLSGKRMQGRWWNEGNKPGGSVWFAIN